MSRRKATINKLDCVACGVCVGACGRNAIRIVRGVYAKIDEELCIGCGKCEKVCSACVIHLEYQAKEVKENETLV